MENSSQKILKTSSLIIVLILVLFMFEYFLLTKISDKKESFLKKQEELSFYWQSIENIKNIDKKLTLYKNEIEEIESVFLNETTIINFIERLEYLASKSALILELERVNVPGNQSGEKPIFDLTIKGDFSNIYQYINMLENDIYQLVFEKVFVKESLDFGWEASLKIKLLSYTTTPLEI